MSKSCLNVIQTEKLVVQSLRLITDHMVFDLFPIAGKNWLDNRRRSLYNLSVLLVVIQRIQRD